MSLTDLIIHDEKANIDRSGAEALGHKEFVITKLYRSA